MEEENFDSPTKPVYQQNKSAFCTERPLEWLQAIDKYMSCDEIVHVRWANKQNADGKFSER